MRGQAPDVPNDIGAGEPSLLQLYELMNSEDFDVNEYVAAETEKTSEPAGEGGPSEMIVRACLGAGWNMALATALPTANRYARCFWASVPLCPIGEIQPLRSNFARPCSRLLDGGFGSHSASRMSRVAPSLTAGNSGLAAASAVEATASARHTTSVSREHGSDKRAEID